MLSSSRLWGADVNNSYRQTYLKPTQETRMFFVRKKKPDLHLQIGLFDLTMLVVIEQQLIE